MAPGGNGPGAGEKNPAYALKGSSRGSLVPAKAYLRMPRRSIVARYLSTSQRLR